MEEFQIPFHRGEHLIHKNQLKNYVLLSISFQVTCIFYKFIIIYNYYCKFIIIYNYNCKYIIIYNYYCKFIIIYNYYCKYIIINL